MAGGKQRVYRQRIHSTQSLQKVFRAQELIAASRIGKARERTQRATPFAKAITQAVGAVVAHGHVDHALTTARHDTNRVAVLVIGADRGMAGSYTANILRDTGKLLEQLRDDGLDPHLYVCGRRAVSYYQYRNHDLAGHWVYGSDRPDSSIIDRIADTLLGAFTAPADAGGVSELYVVYTQFVSMVTQKPTVVRMLPLEVGVDDKESVAPLYDFEPSPEVVLDLLLPAYITARLRSFILESAASELASRQRAMHTATDNAETLVRTYTRLANQARQSDITQEISEIVSGADALAQAQ